MEQSTKKGLMLAIDICIKVRTELRENGIHARVDGETELAGSCYKAAGGISMVIDRIQRQMEDNETST